MYIYIYIYIHWFKEIKLVKSNQITKILSSKASINSTDFLESLLRNSIGSKS